MLLDNAFKLLKFLVFLKTLETWVMETDDVDYSKQDEIMGRGDKEFSSIVLFKFSLLSPISATRWKLA